MRLDLVVGKLFRLVTRRDLSRLSSTSCEFNAHRRRNQLNSTVELRRRCVLGLMFSSSATDYMTKLTDYVYLRLFLPITCQIRSTLVWQSGIITANRKLKHFETVSRATHGAIWRMTLKTRSVHQDRARVDSAWELGGLSHFFSPCSSNFQHRMRVT